MTVYPLSVENVYKKLYKLSMNIAIFEHFYDNDNKKLDKASRKANIYAVKNSWRVFNLLLKEQKYKNKGKLND